MSSPKLPPATETTLVRPSAPLTKSEIINLPIPDQFMVRVYLTQVYCFSLDPQVNPRQVYSDLCCGLSDALVELPVFAGRFVRHDVVRDRIQIHMSPDDAVSFKYSDLDSPDIQPPFPDFHRLEQSHFPPTSLDESLFPSVEAYPTGSSWPALLVKANFIKGGLLLAVNVHHSTADALGRTELFRSWATHTAAAARGSRSTPHRSHETLDRSNLFRVSREVALEDCEILAKVEDVTKASEQRAKVMNTIPENKALSNIRNVNWYFSADNLRALKDASQPTNPADSWISTNDALCALLWRHTTRARKLKESEYENSTFAIPCSVRGRVSPPLVSGYVGNAVYDAHISYPIDELYSTAPDCLYRAASTIRKAINRVDDPTIRNFWGAIDSLPTIGSARHNISLRPGPDFIVTTLAAMGWHNFDWGVHLGRMARMRWLFRDFPSIVMVQPRFLDGGLEVFMSLENEVFERLRLDETFTTFAELRPPSLKCDGPAAEEKNG